MIYQNAVVSYSSFLYLVKHQKKIVLLSKMFRFKWELKPNTDAECFHSGLKKNHHKSVLSHAGLVCYLHMTHTHKTLVLPG